jgi:hypothetical protein
MIDLNHAISRQLSALIQELNLLVLADGFFVPLAFVKSW